MSLFKLPCVTQTERLTPEDRRDELLDRRLAAAAGHRNHGNRERGTPRGAIAPKARRESRTSTCDNGDEASRERARRRRPLRAPRRRSRCRRNGRRGSRRTTSPRRSERVSVVTARTIDRRRRDGPPLRARLRPTSATSWRDSEELGDDGAVAERAPLGTDELLRFVALARDSTTSPGRARSIATPSAVRRSWITLTRG